MERKNSLYLWRICIIHVLQIENGRATGKEDPQDSHNYRPITVLPVVSKVFEQLISDQISKQFDGRLDPRITAYRKRHSCETTLISLIEAWKSAWDNQQTVKILSTDLSKAFDSLHPSFNDQQIKSVWISR